MKYTPLHVHSDCSSDGAGTVSSLVEQAKTIGCEALALTDHGTLGNAVAFWSACDGAGIKPIFGIEAYLLYNNKRHHMTLLSLSEVGFESLIALDSWSHDAGWIGGYPTVTMDALHENKKELYALTGCAASALYVEDEAAALQYVGDLRDAMGKYNVGLEVMFLGTHDTWNRPLAYAKKLKLPYYVTNDTHYPCENQFDAHQVITSARKGYTYDSRHLWLKTAEEIMHEGQKYTDADIVEKGLTNSYYFHKTVAPFSMKAAPTLPHIPDVENTLRTALLEAVKADVMVHGEKEIRHARLRREWDNLKARGFLDYIYILWDIVRFAKSNSISVGPGRGSGGGSYVLYLLGVTSIDPIRFGLLFERFINPSRSDYPDVDVDFESDRRDEVMQYAHNRWGTIPIATYSCYSHKSTIHDIARVMKIPKHLEEAAAEGTADSPAFEDFMNYKPGALDVYHTMNGQIRHRGKHAAGVIVANRPVPIERAPDGTLVAAWAEGMNTKELSTVGIVKYDLLGLTALSQLKRMKELTNAIPPKEDYSDSAVFDLFCSGDVAGIFQWSGSDGIRELTERVAPRNFYDLTTCNALYRPGALDAGTAEHYPEFMKQPRKLHPRLDQHLVQTYGVVCYQEQVMALVAEVMGGDLAQADIARRLLSKAAVGDAKWEKAIEELRVEFRKSGALQGFDESLLAKVWNEIYTHSGYSYNLSHASAYTMISYQMAWYKVYHRAAFTTAVLQYDKANAQTYIVDAVAHGLKVNTPHVNYSHHSDYWLLANETYIPLIDVAFLGEKAAKFIVEQRTLNGEFKGYADFAARIPKRICNNRAKQMLERIGAFEGFSDEPKAAIEKYEEIPVSGNFTTQLDILKFVIPTTRMLQSIEKLLKVPVKKWQSRFAGFVMKTDKKKSSHGEYTVYYLSPTGSFWSREPLDHLKVGMFVAGTKNKFGHQSNVKVYRLD